MNLEQRMRAIKLIELIEKDPQMAQELGITVRQRLVNSDEEKAGKGIGNEVHRA